MARGNAGPTRTDHQDVEIDDRVGCSPELRAEVAAIVAQQKTMEQVVRWALQTGREIASIVVQDEFTHDVVVPFREGLVFVYDTT